MLGTFPAVQLDMLSALSTGSCAVFAVLGIWRHWREHWRGRWRERWREQGRAASDEPGASERDRAATSDLDEEPWQEPEPIEMEIGDVLDLHSFPPREIGRLVRDYLDLAHERGLREVRIIHGKGVGVQRERVRSILEKDPRVVSYGDPPGHQGGWGATWVEMAANAAKDDE